MSLSPETPECHRRSRLPFTMNSSASDTTAHPDSPTLFKKRKVERACDSCRRKKTKCDGPKMSSSVCTNCIQSQKICTYVESSRPRGPSKAYITGMEDRLERLEALLSKLRPDADFSEEIGPPVIRDSWKGADDRRSSMSSRNSSSLPASECSATFQAYPVEKDSPFAYHRVPPPLIHKNPRRKSDRIREDGEQSSPSVSDSSSDGGSSTDDECERLQSLIKYPAHTSDIQSNAVRYHGKSSQSSLVKVTRQFKELRLLELTSSKEVPWQSSLRLEFWSVPPWELLWEGLHSDSPSLIPSLISVFPPPDLALKLCDIYFTYVNRSWPLLHRPTFDRQFNDKLHHRDHWFACLCLSLFAVASQWCSDPRVLPGKQSPHIDNTDRDWHQAGRHYLEAAIDVHRSRRSLVNITSLFEVQTFTLLAMCWRARNLQHLAWLFGGIGLRKAMDIGVHRRRTYGNKPTVEGELWKRAFWLLVAFERIDSVALGRSCILQDEDIDTDLPLEVDDEYWETEDVSMAFRQPKGKPAAATAINLWIQVTQIIAYALRTLYAVDKSKSLFSVATSRKRDEVVAHLNKALTDWIGSVPEHLRWSKKIESPLFSSQSAILYASFHSTRILVYRIFMPSLPTDDADLSKHSTPSLSAISICIDSARSLAEIIDHQITQNPMNAQCMSGAAHFAAALLIGHVWWLKHNENAQRAELQDIKPPVAQTIDELMGHITIFTRALEAAAPRQETAAQYLLKIRESLPDGCDTVPPIVRSESDQRQRYNDELVPTSPARQETNAWQWYSAAQIPSKSAAHYTIASDHLHSSHWKNQEYTHSFADEMQHRGHPHLSSLPPQNSWPNSSTSQQSCSAASRHEFSGQHHLLDLSRRVPAAGLASTDCLDIRPRQGLTSGGAYNANADQDQLLTLQPVAYVDPRQVGRRASFPVNSLKSANWTNTNRRFTEWEDYGGVNGIAYDVTGALWNNSSSFYQTPLFTPRQ